MTRDSRWQARLPIGFCHAQNPSSNFRTLSTGGIFDVDELIELVVKRTGTDSDPAAVAIAATLGHLTARRSSPVVGRIREPLGEVENPRPVFVGDGGVQ